MSPAADAAVPSPSAPDSGAVVATAKGLDEWRSDGTTRRLVAQADILSCVVDPRLQAVWFLTSSEGHESTELRVVDRDGNQELVAQLPLEGSGPEGFVIQHGPRATLARPHAVHFAVLPMLDLSELQTPTFRAEIGCSGDQSWFCYDETGPDEEPELIEELVAYAAAIEGTPVEKGPLLTRLLQEAAGRPLPNDEAARPDGGDETFVESVGKQHCEVEELCGSTTRVPNTAFWLVTVANARGDFYYNTQQFYDPQTAAFFDPSSPATRTKQPLEVEGELVDHNQGMISNDGRYLVTEAGLFSFTDGTLVAGRGQPCGFWDGGTRMWPF